MLCTFTLTLNPIETALYNTLCMEKNKNKITVSLWPVFKLCFWVWVSGNILYWIVLLSLGLIYGTIENALNNSLGEAIQWAPAFIFSIVFFVCSLWYIIKLFRTKTPYMIKSECLVFAVVGFTCIAACLFYIFHFEDQNRSRIYRLWAILILTYVYLLSVYLFPMIAMFRSEISVINMPFSKETLISAITTPNLWKHLKFQINEDYCLENALFLEQILKVNNSKDLKNLYQNFLMPDSPNELNISGKMKEELHKHFKSNTLQLNHFEAIKSCVIESIYTNSFPRFWKQHLNT